MKLHFTGILMAVLITGCGLPEDGDVANSEGLSTAQTQVVEQNAGIQSELPPAEGCDYATCMQYCTKEKSFDICHSTCNRDCSLPQ